MVKIFFWLSIFLIFYSYAGYIAFCLLLSLFFGKDITKKEYCPDITIIVPCYNEESFIRRKIENLLATDYPPEKKEIIIASESTDATNTIAEEFKDRGIILYESTLRRGKTPLLYNTVHLAHGQILIFTDANVQFKNDALKKITANFHDKRVGAVSGLLSVINPQFSDISWGETLYKKYETILRKANSRLGRVLNSDGAIFAIRKELYSPINSKRGDDFELVIRVLMKGYFSVFEEEAVSFENASETSKAEINRKVRITSWFIKSSFILLKEMFSKSRFDLAFQIISHKVLRWLTPCFFIVLFLSSAALFNEGISYSSLFLAQAFGYILGGLGWYLSEIKKRKPPLIMKIAHYFLMYNYAFLIGLVKGIFYWRLDSAVWDKTRS
jgi:cellulose synthase/poly-beta-1,6-N-acetylglucosamine synthase-like glycosyltransferase